MDTFFLFFTISFIKGPKEQVKTEKNVKLVARIIGAKHGSVSPLKQWRGATAVAPGLKCYASQVFLTSPKQSKWTKKILETKKSKISKSAEKPS